MAPKTSSDTPPEPAAALPAEVEAQLTAAADQLEAAHERAESAEARAIQAEANLAQAREDLAAAQAEARTLRDINADLSAKLAAAGGAGGYEPAPALAGPALRDPLTKGVKITVQRGQVEHPRAKDGVAREGESFFVTKEEAEALRAPLASGVLAAE